MAWIRRTIFVYIISLAVAVVVYPFLSGHAFWEVPSIILSIVLWVTGIYLSLSIYGTRAKTGEIAVGNIPIQIFADTIAAAGGAFLLTVAIDALWVMLPEHTSQIGLDPDWVGGTNITGLHFVSFPGLLIGIPFFTFFTTATYAQRLTFSDSGLHSTRVFGGSRIAWDQVKTVEVIEDRSVAQVAARDYRTLEKILKVGSDEAFIVIHQPTSRRKKQLITEQLRRHLPDVPRRQLDAVSADW